jgi:hypothetical protein
MKSLAINISGESWGYNQMSNAEITNKWIVYLLKQAHLQDFYPELSQCMSLTLAWQHN